MSETYHHVYYYQTPSPLLRKPFCNSAHICSWCGLPNQSVGWEIFKFHPEGPVFMPIMQYRVHTHTHTYTRTRAHIHKAYRRLFVLFMLSWSAIVQWWLCTVLHLLLVCDLHANHVRWVRLHSNLLLSQITVCASFHFWISASYL